MKKGFWGYCLKSRKSPLIHAIFKTSELPGMPSCYTPKPNKRDNFLDVMRKKEKEEIIALLKDISLTEEERNYFKGLLNNIDDNF